MSAKILNFPSKAFPTSYCPIVYTVVDENIDIQYEMEFDNLEQAQIYFEYYGIELDREG